MKRKNQNLFNRKTKKHCLMKYQNFSIRYFSLVLLLSIGYLIGSPNLNVKAQSCDANFYGGQVEQGTEARFLDTSNMQADHTWYMGDGTKYTDSGYSFKHDYGQYGTFQVCHVVEDNNCKDSTCRQIQVNCDPNTGFRYKISNKTVDFKGYNYGAISYEWNFGDGSKGQGSNPNHTYSSSGTYTVKLKVTYNQNPKCVDSTTNKVQIQKSNPCNVSADFYYSVNGKTVSFTNQSSTTPYKWYFGDGNTSTKSNPTHTYGSEDTFRVKLLVKDGNNCYDSAIKSVNTVSNSKPCNLTADFSYLQNGYTVSFYGKSNSRVSQYKWDFGDGNTSNKRTPSHTYSKQDTFQVELVMVKSSSCSDTVTKQIWLENDNHIRGALKVNQNTRLDEGIAYLYKYDSCKGVYNKHTHDTFLRADTIDYYFNNLPSGKYYVKAKPTSNSQYSSNYVATYHQNATNWTNADSIVITGIGKSLKGKNINLVKSSNSNGTGNITGYVSGNKAPCPNKRGGGEEALADVPVLLLNEDRDPVDRTLTNESGDYAFEDLDEGQYFVKVDLPGYTTEEDQVSLTSESNNKKVNFEVDEGKVSISDETSGILNHPKGTEIEVYPSPARSNVKVDIITDEMKDLTINVIDMNGQPVQHRDLGSFNGEQTVNLDVSDWNAGPYVLQITDQYGQVKEARQLMVK